MIFSHVLYQLSYPATHAAAVSNHGASQDTEAGATGLEPATSDVTGRRSNQLNYAPANKLRDYRTSRAPSKWAQQDLNLRPPACKAGAPPLSYAPRRLTCKMPPGEFESPPSP
jgi:hypothetical protein